MPRDIKPIARVTARKVTGGYRYIAHYQDGTSEVIRKLATRRFENAFQTATGGNNGADSDSLAGFFTWGKTPNRYAATVATFRVEDEPAE